MGPETEDAIHRALATKQGCSSDECAADAGDGSTGKSDAVQALGRLGWIAIGDAAVASVAAVVTLAFWGRGEETRS